MLKLVLASKSPRRKQILLDYNIYFQTYSSEINEEDYENLSPEKMVRTLSLLKAEKANSKFPKHLILAADTTVNLNGKIFSKARDLEQAKVMLKDLSGSIHEVITGYTIIEPGKKPKTFSNTTKIYFKKISEKLIDNYINNHEVLDKAGAYGIQDGADSFVKKYEGDYLNIVGLPTEAVIKIKKILNLPTKEEDILKIIKEDVWMMKILKAAEKLNLPDWWIGAGFVRSKIWDYQHNFKKRTPIPDIDVIYFDKNDYSKDEINSYSTKKEEEYQKILSNKIPKINWSVTNQARIHKFHNRKPYKNSSEALSDWSETATCIGIKKVNNKLILTAPHGIEDLLNLKVRKIPDYNVKYKHDPKLFEKRIKDKKWLKKWPKLKVINN